MAASRSQAGLHRPDRRRSRRRGHAGCDHRDWRDARHGGGLGHDERHAGRGERGEQHHARHLAGVRDSDRHRCRQSTEYVPGGGGGRAHQLPLRHLCDDGWRDVDLHARRKQRGGAGAQCRQPAADRHLRGAHPGRHPAAGDDHHQRRQRRGGGLGHDDRLGDRGWRGPATARSGRRRRARR